MRKNKQDKSKAQAAPTGFCFECDEPQHCGEICQAGHKDYPKKAEAAPTPPQDALDKLCKEVCLAYGIAYLEARDDDDPPPMKGSIGWLAREAFKLGASSGAQPPPWTYQRSCCKKCSAVVYKLPERDWSHLFESDEAKCGIADPVRAAAGEQGGENGRATRV